MTARTLAPWVEPVAAELRKTRAEIADFTRSAPADFWAKPSPNATSTNKELLAHLATSHWVMQANVGAVLDGRPFHFEGPDAGNAERVRERQGVSVEELATEVEEEGKESEELLAKLTPEHQEFRHPGATWTLADMFRGFVNDDPHHLNQLRDCLDQVKAKAES